jgi:four helix bundle suffix protein
MEIKLTNVARASLGELLLDYEDFLRQRRLPQWDKNSPQALAVRQAYRSSDKSDQSDQSDGSDAHGWRTASAEVLANTMICLINQASALLRNQIRRLEQDFLQHGGLRERMTRARLESRVAQQATPRAPQCPQCGKPMRLRTARVGKHVGRSFWGCSGYPECRGIREVDRN